jgi:hypothetical protein
MRVNARPQQRHAQEDTGIATLDLLEQGALAISMILPAPTRQF